MQSLWMVVASLLFACMGVCVKRGKTMVSASLAYSTVVLSSLFGMWLWDETLPLIAQLGVGLILVSGILASSFSQAAPVEQD